MGLLKNLLKSVAGDALSQLKETLNTTMAGQAPQPARKVAQAPSSPQPVEVPERSEAEWQAYFRDILQTEFSGYGIREDVPVTAIAGAAADEFQLYRTRPTQVYRAEWGQPYTFVLDQGGVPKAVVMLGAGHSHSANVKYLIARMYAKKSGLPYINFYTQMPNERGYVIGRLHRFLG